MHTMIGAPKIQYHCACEFLAGKQLSYHIVAVIRFGLFYYYFAVIIIFQISEKLKSLGLESDSKINWRKGEGEDVFHRKITRTASSSDKCHEK